MLRTNIVTDISQIPSNWVFEHFCNLTEKLTGQNVKIRSIFTHEKTPSMFINNVEGNYMFKDFSSGYGGDSINLIERIYTCDFIQAMSILISTYNEYLNQNPDIQVIENKAVNKFKLKDYEIRNWNKEDKEYWLKFNVSSSLLENHNIYPLSFFTIDNGIKAIKYTHTHIYGYFTEEGVLYRVYQPLSKGKFFIFNSHIQGLEQLDSSKYCIVTSSLKDLLTIKSFNIKNLTGITVPNENVMLQPAIMSNLFIRHTKVFILLDNDETGIRSTERYVNIYEGKVTPLYLKNYSKDISDSVKDYGVDPIKRDFYELLKKNI